MNTLRHIAQTLRRRADDDHPLTVRELRTLAAALEERETEAVQRGVVFVDFVRAPAFVPRIVPGAVGGAVS
jgi:hypothetical protein